ncbi:MAG: glycosyl hydrolase [Elusimicrobia bacterium CG_4_9_14_3_um_filter_62_55]|nr:MAG: glycosyl hydrolase [Elusimicrobia bacterium CG22_combo_CG10-13_8_21_14_all_63_91]PJB26904.1 MAG: glycosyl hydrolase [Elusimicrobia bacterium CG_4_9_14_3_um_filter_62_55]
MSITLLFSVLLCAAPLRPALGAPAVDVSSRVESLLGKMTLEEKFGQLQQLDGDAGGDARPEHFELAKKGLLGSTLNVRGAKRVNELQRAAVEHSRLGIPILFAFDVIHGYRTVFPVPLAEAASWDASAVERAAAVAAAEAYAAGVRWTFAPMVDVARDPRWGRIVEGSGEDPFLGAVMARARVRGFQGPRLGDPGRVAACAKHWAAYGAAVAGRDYNTVDVSERTLREVYFPPFRASAEEGVASFMSAFNALNGIPASADRWILTDVLRGEWGFDGLVVSDYTSVQELIAHGFARDGAEAARLALSAGVDMEMVSRLYNEHGPGLMESGGLSQQALDEAVRRVLRLKFRLGLFERPYADEQAEAGVLLSTEHAAAARDMAVRSMVLLKNDGSLLPLGDDRRTIAVVGPLADDRAAPMGSWTGDGRVEDVVTILEGIRARAGARRVLHAQGCGVSDPAAGGIDEAVAAARQADVVIAVVGEDAAMSGEAASRSTLDLPGRQLDLLKALHATGKPLAVVLLNGRPLILNWLDENVPALLEAWFPGGQAGTAVADVLFGDANPGGRLPVTFPRALGQVPIYYAHKNTGRPPSENKYSSKYLDVPVTPLYPFGYGLSYTRFRLAELRLSARSIRPDGRLRVSVDVENTGPRPGDEVVQLYIRDATASAVRPVRELRGWERLSLAPGERRRVEFELTPEHLGALDGALRFGVEPGEFQVFVGSSSVGGLESSFEVVAY